MRAYILKRLLLFIPTLFGITLLGFWLLQAAPGDPVRNHLRSLEPESREGPRASDAEYLRLRHELGLDKPLFYLSVSPLAMPDTLYRVPYPEDRATLSRLIDSYGNWEAVQAYFIHLQTFTEKLQRFRADSTSQAVLSDIRSLSAGLAAAGTPEKIAAGIVQIDAHFQRAALPDSLLQPWSQTKALAENLENQAERWKNYVPTLYFYGIDNQYHHWLANFLSGNFGRSYIDGRPVSEVIFNALRWTFLIGLLGTLLTYSVAIPMGVLVSQIRDPIYQHSAIIGLLAIDALPLFWLALLLIRFFANPDYLDWFPSGGVASLDNSAEWPFFRRIGDWVWHLFLPVVVYSFGAIAFLSLQMRSGMLDTINQDYIRTALAKGTPDRKVIWKHAFRNALFPILTSFANVFPGLVGGAVILETVFSIPGMGSLTYKSILSQDYPLVIILFMLFSVLTLAGVLVADILYRVADPRISFSPKAG